MDMKTTFDELAAFLKPRCIPGRTFYLPNPGNWGDGLIRHGALKFFRHYGIEAVEFPMNKKAWLGPLVRGGTVIYGGGGAWCGMHTHSERVVRMLSRRFQVVVLPSTYDREFSIPRTSFFVRDQHESDGFMASAKFCHDMAFFIGDDFKTGETGQGEAYFFREDRESARRIPIPAGNVDLSQKGNHLTAVDGFFEAINRYRVIHTDRLHVCVAASLLGKEVHLHPGAYFKNRAIYESSLKPFFKNTQFHDFE